MNPWQLSQLPKEIKTTLSTTFLQIVKIYLVHLRRDRREAEMSMPHAITLCNGIQYQRQTFDHLVSSHMARQMVT